MSSTKILVLDGQSDSIILGVTNVSGTLAEGSSAFTISAWLKPSSLSAAASRHGVSNIFFARTGDGTPDVFELGISQGGNLQVMTRALAGKQVDTVGNGELTVGEWHFVGLSFDSGTLTAILNNTKYTAHVAAPFSNPEPSPVSIGTNNRGIFFDGSILDVRVWSIARTEDAIKGDKGQWMLGSEPSLISNWQLIDGSGTTAANFVDESLHGTMVGGQWVVDGDLPVSEPGLLSIDLSTVPEPLKSFGITLVNEINSAVGSPSGDLVLTAGLLGDFSFFDTMYGLEDLALITIKGALLQILGQGEFELPSQNVSGGVGLRLVGTVELFGQEITDTRIEFFLKNDQSYTAVAKFFAPTGTEETWGVDSIFPVEVPLVSAIKFQQPAVVFSNADVLDDIDFPAGINTGVNFFGNFLVANSGDALIDFIGSTFGIDKLNIHTSISQATAGLQYLLEGTAFLSWPLIPLEDAIGFELLFENPAVELSILGADVSLGIGHDMRVNMNWGGEEELLFTGSISGDPDAISGAYTFNKTGADTLAWEEPFGIPGITINQLAAQIGLSYTSLIEDLGFSGNLEIGTIAGSITVYANKEGQFALIGQTDEITLLEIMTAMTPPTLIAYQALPDEITNTFDKVIDVKLTGIDEDGVFLNIVPTVPVEIGELSFQKQGTFFEGRLEAWGWGAQVSLAITTDTFIIDAAMDAVEIGSFFSITGSGTDEFPILHLQLGALVQPELYVSAAVRLFGLQRELLIEADAGGFLFSLTDSIGDILTLALECGFADRQFTAGGSIDFNLNVDVGPIYLAGIPVADKISLVDISFNADTTISAGVDPIFSFAVLGGFEFWGVGLDFPTLHLTVEPDNFENLHNIILNEIKDSASDIFGVLFSSAGIWAEKLAAGAFEFTGDVATTMKDAFDTGAEEAAELLVEGWNYTEEGVGIALKGAGYAVDEVAKGLDAAFDVTTDGIAIAMKGAGYAATEVADGLKTAFGSVDWAVGNALGAAGFAAEEAVNAIKDTFGHGIDEVTEALDFAAYSAGELAEGLKEAFDASIDEVASAMHNATTATWEAVEDIAAGLEEAFNASSTSVGEALEFAGYTAEEAVAGVKSAFDATIDEVTEALDWADYTAEELADGLKEVFNASIDEVADAMENAGPAVWDAIGEVSEGLKDAFDASKATVGEALEQAGYLAEEAVEGIQIAFDATIDQVTEALDWADYTAEEMASALSEVFNASIDEVADAMENAGPAVWEAVGEIAEGLDVAFDATGAEIGEAMEYAGYTASETIEGLKIAKDKTEAGIAEALDYSNYTINEIADGIEDVYDASYNVIADALEYANRWDIDEIGGALQHIGATTAEALADALQYAGFAVDEVGYFLKDVGGFADDVVNDALVAAGYVASAIEEFMGDAFGWVAEVLDPGNWG